MGVSALLAVALAVPAPAGAQTGEHDAPYSFLRDQTDQIAVPGFEAGTGVVPTGDLYTGYTEFGVRVGPGRRAFPARYRELEGGRYPVITSYLVDGDIAWTFTTFAANVGPDPVNFLRLEARNLSVRPRTATVVASVRHNGGRLVPRGRGLARQFRFPRPIAPERPGLYSQPGYPFDATATYGFAGNAVTRNGQVLYSFGPPPAGGRVARTARPGQGAVVPGTTFGQTTHRVVLGGAGSAAFEFRMPVVPITAGTPQIGAIAATDLLGAKRKLIAGWRGLFQNAMQVSLPEKKATDAYYANLMHMLLPRYRGKDGYWIQAVNKLRYHAFYLRDTTVIAQAFDAVGLHRQAGEDLVYYLDWQDPEGLFISRPGQYDGHGQALWSFGDHYRRTGSKPFLDTVYPAVKKGMAWLIRTRAADPLKLLPTTTPLDNELITGKITGENFWGVIGAEQAVELAKAAGDAESAAAWTAEAAAYRSAVGAALAGAVKRTGGYIPPALDVAGGQDWGNLWVSYPGTILPATAPAVGNTLAHVRRKFREGLATYADTRSLHAYLGFRVFQTELLRDEQEKVVRGFYDELAHTTSTHGGFEANLAPFGTRVIADATTPHGWFAAELILLLRNMLVREEGNGLVLGGALSPAWLQPGKRVVVKRARTLFGTIDWSLTARDGGATLRWSAPKLKHGTTLRFSLPSVASDVSAAGVSADETSIVLPGPSGSLPIDWTLPRSFPTFESAVTRLLRQYRQAGAASAGQVYRGPLTRNGD